MASAAMATTKMMCSMHVATRLLMAMMLTKTSAQVVVEADAAEPQLAVAEHDAILLDEQRRVVLRR